VQKREETIKETEHAERTSIRTNPDGSNGGSYTPQGHRQTRQGQEEAEEPLEASGQGEHLIDFTA